MIKPDSLRAALVAALPDLDRDPDALTLFVSKGRAAARAAPPLAWEYRYQLTAVLLDFAGDEDVVFATVIDWVRAHQPELLLNHERADEAISFAVAVLDAGAVDLSIDLDLVEAVVRMPRQGGGFDYVHQAEPDLVDQEIEAALAGLPDDTPLAALSLGVDRIIG